METKIVIAVALVTLASLILVIEGCDGPNCFNPQWKKDAESRFYDEDTKDLLAQERERELKLREAVKTFFELLIPESKEYRDRRAPYKTRNADDKRRGFGSRIITLKKSADTQ
ncbi:uncharacterized protein LOC144441115 [Glandiceps talaboti]